MTAAFRRGSVQPLTTIAERYGDVAYLGFPIQAYVVSSAEGAAHVLVRNHHNYRKSNNYREMRQVMGDGLVTSEGERWVAQRRIVGSGFVSRAIESYAPVIADQAKAMVHRWKSAGDGEEPFDLEPHLVELSCGVASRLFFGVSAQAVAQRVHHAARIAGDAVIRRIYSPFPAPRWIPTRGNRAERAAVRTLDSIIYEVLDRETMSPEGSEPEATTVLSLLRGAHFGGGSSPLPPSARRRLRDELMTLFVAGHDTICASLVWFYYLLGQHPEVQARVQAEVDQVVGRGEVTHAATQGLRFTRSVLLESLRLYPAIPVVARTPKAEDRIHGLRIPPESVVLIPVQAIHRDGRYWPNPLTFDPERFLETGTQTKGSFLPFALGPRRCIGAGLAMLEALIVVATLAQSYSIQVEPGFSAQPHTTITMRSKNGLQVRALPRRAASIKRSVAAKKITEV